MQTETKWQKTSGFAYATSDTATKLGFPHGCYYVAVERATPSGKIITKNITGHATLDEATANFRQIDLPAARWSVIES